MLIVSHDHFCTDCLNKVFEFKEGKVRNHLGGMEDYIYQLWKAQQGGTDGTPAMARNIREPSKSNARLTYEQEGEQQRQMRRAETAVQEREQEDYGVGGRTG